MGEIYRVRDPQLGREVAVKIVRMPPGRFNSRSGSEGRVGRFSPHFSPDRVHPSELDGFAGALSRLRGAYDEMQQTWPATTAPYALIDARALSQLL